MKNLADIRNGVIANIIVVDPKNVPEAYSNWPEVFGLGVGAVFDVDAASDNRFAELVRVVRAERDDLLKKEVDPYATNILVWNGLTPVEQTDLALYRLALLDVPQQAGFPKTHTWPNKP